LYTDLFAAGVCIPRFEMPAPNFRAVSTARLHQLGQWHESGSMILSYAHCPSDLWPLLIGWHGWANGIFRTRSLSLFVIGHVQTCLLVVYVLFLLRHGDMDHIIISTSVIFFQVKVQLPLNKNMQLVLA
jgi:hypothetical protein